MLLRTLRAGHRLLDGLRYDARHAARSLRRSPLFTLVAVGSLGIGLSAHTVAVTLYDALFLRPVALPSADQLVRVVGVNARNERVPLFSNPDFRALRDRSAGAVALAAVNKVAAAVGEAPPPAALYDDYALPAGYRFAHGRIVSGNYFAVLRGRIAYGRALAPDDDVPGREPVVVLGHRFWQREFQGDPGAVGRTIALQGVRFTIVGIAAPEFTGTDDDVPSFWAPLSARDALVRGWWTKDWYDNPRAEVLSLVGRLQPGVPREQARAVLSGIARTLAADARRAEPVVAVRLAPGGTRYTRNEETAPIADTFLSAVWLVLLVACANCTSLLLARASERQKEIGVRLAIGASRARLVRQLVTESVLLCLVGGAVGLGAAELATRVLYPLALGRLNLPSGVAEAVAIDLAPDLRVFAYTLLVSAGIGVLLGLVPALEASRSDLTAVIKRQGSALGERVRPARLRETLVVAQVALSLVLLVSAGLLVRSLRAEQRVDPGYSTRGVYAVAVGRRAAAAGDSAGERALRAAVARRLADVPGVRAVTGAAKPPLSGSLPMMIGETVDDRGRAMSTPLTVARIAPNYAPTMGLSVVRGRGLDDPALGGATGVAVVNESAARELWPGRSPLGRELVLASPALAGRTDAAPPERAVVIGVARDARTSLVWRRDGPMVYLPTSLDASGMVLLVRTDPLAPTAGQVRVLREAAESAERDVVASVKPIDATLDVQLAPFRGIALTATVLGALALVLTAGGLFGIMAFTVARRMRELALRIALGATPQQVLRLALARGARTMGLGLAIGLAAAGIGSRVLRAVLVDVSPLDPVAFGAVSLVVAAVTLLAAVVPARRAVRADPADLLRAE